MSNQRKQSERMSVPIPRPPKPSLVRRLICASIIAVTVVFDGYKEFSLAQKLSPDYDLIMDSYVLPTDEKVDPSYNRDVVFLRSSHVSSHPVFAPGDFQFGLMFGTRLTMHRVVEYCQWHEFIPKTHDNTTATPIYYKQWTDKAIDSSSFVNPVGHENNLRNPLNQHDLVPRYVQARAFRIDYSFLRDLSLPFVYRNISAGDLESIPIGTRQLGFYYASSHWFYSKAAMEGINQPPKENSVRFLTPEEEDAMENDCMSGDLRVSHAYQNVPRTMTLVGVQNDDLILPVRDSHGSHPIAAIGNLTAEELVAVRSQGAITEMRMIRILAAGVIAAAMWMMRGVTSPFHFLPHWIRSVAVALLSIYILTLSVWVAAYGWESECVWRLLPYFAIHTILIVLLNVMFYLIRLYRFALMLQEQKKKEQ